MLYVYYGTDGVRIREEARKQADTVAQQANVDVVVIESNEASLEHIQSLVGVTSLFEPYQVFLLDSLSADSDLFSNLLKHITALAKSHNHFVLVEGALTPGEKKLCKTEAEICLEFTKEEKGSNPFALSDALLARDKKKLWILLQAAWKEGRSSEEIIGTLFWQLKMLRLAEVTKTATEAGQKPFVYEKAKRALSKFKKGEITKITHTLVMLYHEGHAGKRTLDHALEAWVLTL